MVDLGCQQDRIRAGLERKLHSILHHREFIQGPEIRLLEQRLANYVGVDECIAVSSGTDALLIALMALGIGPGDEILTTPFSFIATAEVIHLVGATPVYIDVDPRTGNLDATRLEAAIKQTTRLILPVSLYGQCADMTEVMLVADRHHLPVIEDAAQSFGATHYNRRSCGLSTIGCTSFFPSKPLGAYGDAGAIFTEDQALAKTMREIRSHGQSSRYHHLRLGINGRMDSIQAAVLLEKLSIIDDELDRRQNIADRYNDSLDDLASQTDLLLPYICDGNRSAWAQYTIQIPGRDVLVKMFSEAGIPSAVHYPNAIFQQPAFLRDINDCPKSIELANKVMSIPMHPYLSADMQQRVVECLYSSIN
ncbi:MAG: aminotransferase DegT [Acidiferrobacteraceae bacterium]|nr:aminotransferase DegT [Acidiferrobacteraceae bacterium]